MLLSVLCFLQAYDVDNQILLRGAENGQRIEVLASPVPGRGQTMYLREDAADSLHDLIEYANRSGFEISINYAFRSWREQKKLFRASPRLAAEPGFSTHQSGLSIDINFTHIKKCKKCPSIKTEFYYWLRAEAPRFGFVNDVDGEPWHWTFVGKPNDNLFAEADFASGLG